MKKQTFFELVASRLEDLADQVDYLVQQGDFESADLLREEGLMLAQMADNGDSFLFIPDLTTK